jgi:hypothetical protein
MMGGAWYVNTHTCTGWPDCSLRKGKNYQYSVRLVVSSLKNPKKEMIPHPGYVVI